MQKLTTNPLNSAINDALDVIPELSDRLQQALRVGDSSTIAFLAPVCRALVALRRAAEAMSRDGVVR
jgi:hypothetical protein